MSLPVWTTLSAAPQSSAESQGFVRTHQERPLAQFNGEIYISGNHAAENVFLNFPKLLRLLPESYEHKTLCLMLVIKSTNLNFEHTKDEPDRLTHDWEKRQITINQQFFETF